jgi:hypothetical protein
VSAGGWPPATIFVPRAVRRSMMRSSQFIGAV